MCYNYSIMKRVVYGLFFIIAGVLPGVADDAATPSRVLPTVKTTDSGTNTSNSTTTRTAVTSRAVVPSRAISGRSDAAASSTGRTSGDAGRVSLDDSSRTSRTATTTSTPSRVGVTSSRANTTTVTPSRVSSRAAGNTNAGQSAREKLEEAVNTVGRNARVTAASINETPAARRAGVTLRPTTAEVGGRAVIAGTNIQTGSNIKSEVRTVQSRAATNTTVPTAESIAEAKERLEQTADLNKSCQEQYNDCMDQFCAVIDANQKRCSCSSNLDTYARSESRVKDANVQLNDVAQRIRYVGLSADEIRAIMSATEAEQVLSGTRDNSESRNMLQEIEDLISNPVAVSSSSSGSASSTLDMDLDFSSDGGDMFNLDFLNNNSSDLSRKRGKDLYNAAKTQCASILNRCKTAGASSQQITANYEFAIDRDCIAYEQGLAKMTDTAMSNVRSANLMLQKARLAVLNNKNQYTPKECVAALDACMKDDMVCGEKYTKCLDPTKRYIDENGNVVLGENISDITAFMNGYNNADIDSDFLSESANISIDKNTCKASDTNEGQCNVKYLMQKIGMGATVNDGGLCRAVLDKCQRYTYNNGNYNPYNDIVVNYVQRAMVNIKAAQYQIISDYASTCLTDLSKCYNTQVSQAKSWTSSATTDSIYNVMRGACRNVALTCAYAVFSKDDSSCPSNEPETCINSISAVFYQSLLCPANSTFDTATDGGIPKDGATTMANGEKAYVSKRCYCNTGYTSYQGECKICSDGQEFKDGKCVTKT